ncbi:BREX-1 system phosphatase PglZ type A [Candidatus Woesearchaeota archaeon]|nr:BREX-1 system phosphatase PglZ type A [Cryomorphaceae bacterium]MBT3814410.1 BREX-1 system phosphatase PglZ type A [Candidatus Woesearchaeota archaeon]MBT4336379.1 BREX-1 system phosphatase PglZ type A [Candidatus Woesearchaeota archaeon]MBT4469966.1 BREX-1 system phosphatase PglZ type A [Candidatus Woesearchaeota archaeon]MBT6744310.1 BREX-1 system phosphatase PglZ type A [Candidatus Woesearchaeota archaeon]
MANVEKTIKGLLSKFNARESYETRKIVFWYDTDKTAKEEDIKEIQSELEKQDIKIVILKNNFFEIKKIIEHDNPESNFLVYSQENEKKYEENWLLDVQLYSTRFENSRVADVKSIFNIDGSKLDKFIDAHYNFFQSKTRVELLIQLYHPSWDESDFEKGLLAVITRTKVLDTNSIVRNLLIKSLEEQENEFWLDIEKYNISSSFWDLVKNTYGYKSDYPKLSKLFYSFIVTHIEYHTKTILKGYNSYINERKNDCEVFLNSWIRDSENLKAYQEYASHFEESNFDDLRSQFDKKTNKDICEAEALEFFDKALIINISNQLSNNGQNYSSYKELIEHRKGKVWYKNYKPVYQALDSAISLFEFISGEKIDPNSLSKLYSLYKTKYHKADYYYRKFYEHFDQCKSDILKKKLRSEVEKIYHNKFLDRFIEIWTNAVTSENKKDWSIGSNSTQNEFYDLYVKKYASKKNKVVIIISDALRYEVANELKNKLNVQLRGSTEIKDLVGVVPSCTKIGMASLLPHKTLNYNQGTVSCDGINTQGIKNREKILQNKNNDSIAINYKELIRLTRQQTRDLFRGMNVVYIYHNKIDDVGDNANSENEVFSACKNAIDEIKTLINDLTNSISLANIIVTADHGFIYKRETLKDVDKVELNRFNRTNIVDSSKRYVVTNENIDMDNVHKFSLDYAEGDLLVYVPKGNLRFKTQGAGVNFVHGGITPQEITIPVLVYKHTRSDKDLDKKNVKHGYVNVTLLNTSRKITTNITPINLYQTEKVTEKLKPIKCKISLIDPDTKEKVSDEKTLIIDSGSENPDRRKYNTNLTLKSSVENKKHLLRILKVEEEKEELIQFDIDLAMTNDFDDF